MAFTYEYPRPALTTDVMLVTREPQTRLLLIQRGNQPFIGKWALPGGFVDMDEDLPQAALRELREETGIEDVDIVQFRTYGGIKSDPRDRTISVVFTAVIDEAVFAHGMDDAADARWFELDNLPDLAFDHQLIIEEAVASLRNNGSL
jgi:8-oxo-dGTP diphosphatase